jgi:predicted Zn-dependent protease
MKHTSQGLSELLRAASQQGARACEAMRVTEKACNVEVARGRITSFAKEDTARWTLRCWLDDGRVGVSTGGFDAVFEGIGDNLTQAAASEPAEHAGPVERLPVELAGLGILDRRYGALTDEERSELAIRTERDARTADRRIMTNPFTYRDVFSSRAYLNTRGVRLEEVSTTYELRGSAEIVSGAERFSLSDSQEGRGFTDVTTLPMGKRLAQRAVRLLKRGGRLKDTLPTILSPRATAVLVEQLAPCFTAESVSAGRSFLHSAEGISDKIHLLDDGNILGGMATWSFDERGVPPVPLVLVGSGNLSGRFLSPEEARQVGTRPTGHCRADRTGPTNLILRQGTRSINAVMTERGDRCFWVDDITDLMQLDLESGQLRALVNGVVYNGAKVEGSCRNVQLVGDLGHVLRNVVHVFSNTDRVRCVDAPALMVEGFRYSQ